MAIFVDGLEKSSADAARAIVRVFLQYSELATFVFVVPPSLVTGPDAHELLGSAKLFPIRAIDVEPRNGMGSPHGAFFEAMLARRLGAPELTDTQRRLVVIAARLSGGMPRTFLQLLETAAGYAALNGRLEPDESDLGQAIEAHSYSLRRLLRDGDLAEITSAELTDGTEIPLDRKIRFLVQGLVLEYEIDGRTVVRSSPLLMPRSTLSAP